MCCAGWWAAGGKDWASRGVAERVIDESLDPTDGSGRTLAGAAGGGGSGGAGVALGSGAVLLCSRHVQSRSQRVVECKSATLTLTLGCCSVDVDVVDRLSVLPNDVQCLSYKYSSSTGVVLSLPLSLSLLVYVMFPCSARLFAARFRRRDRRSDCSRLRQRPAGGAA